jgi:hypothetical protein
MEPAHSETCQESSFGSGRALRRSRPWVHFRIDIESPSSGSPSPAKSPTASDYKSAGQRIPVLEILSAVSLTGFREFLESRKVVLFSHDD